MSVKTIIRNRKMKDMGASDTFAIQQLVSYIKEVLDEDVESGKNDISEITKISKDNLEQVLATLLNSLDGNFKDKYQQFIDSLNSLNSELKNEFDSGKNEIIKKCSDDIEKILSITEKKATSILLEVSKNKGPQGNPGPKGADGSPDSPEVIAKKLNTTINSVNMSVVKGLLEKIQELKDLIKKMGGGKNGGGSGGGMGQVQHEVKSISAGTSTVQTVYPIAGNGNAIFKAAYQGQILDKDVHFTVGGDRKTITFDSAVQAQFVNGTVFSITYSRG